MGRRIYLARPRLDCSFKPGPVPEREGPPNTQIREKLAEFLNRLESYHTVHGDEVVTETKPLWQFDLASMQDRSRSFDILYFPHKQRREFNIGPNALFYKQTAFPEWITVDRMGWGAGLEQMFEGSEPDAEDQAIFSRLRERIAENVSKFSQPAALEDIPRRDYDLFVCQIPHDEAILLHSEVTVAEALSATVAFAEEAGRHLLVKGYPGNPKAMAPLRAIAHESRHATWVDDVSIHTCLKNAGTVFLVNSGVGFEAMLHGKPMVHFGRAEYSAVVPRARPDPASIAEHVGRAPDVARYKAWMSHFIGTCVEISDPASYERIIEDKILKIEGDAAARNAPRRQVVMCGFSRSGSTLLFNMMRSTVKGAKLPERECTAYGYADVTDADVVTKRPLDVFEVEPISRRIASRKCFRTIVTVRDVRSLLTSTHNSTGAEYFQGFDHCFKVNEGGLLSFSNPGIIETARQIRNLRASRDDVMIVRYEDLICSTEETQERIRAFTGLEMEGSFQAFHTSDIPERLRVQLNGVRPVDRSTADKWKKKRHAERIVRQFRLEPRLFEELEYWGYEPDRVWFERLAAETPQAFDDTPGTVVAFYTAGTGYEAEARRLEATLKRLGVPYDFTAIDKGADWLANVRRKPQFLMDRRNALRGPLLYVDVDAVLHSNPWPYLRGYDGDVAVSTHGDGTVISGTILLNDTPEALRLLRAWEVELEENPGAWDQWGLHTLVQRARMQGSGSPYRVQYLPPAMCYVFDRTGKQVPGVVPVVEHLQASREFRADGGSEKHRENLDRRRKRIAEIHGEIGLPTPEYGEGGLFTEGSAFIETGEWAVMRSAPGHLFKSAKEMARQHDYAKAAALYGLLLKTQKFSDYLSEADLRFRIGLCLIRADRADEGLASLLSAVTAESGGTQVLAGNFEKIARLGRWDVIGHGIDALARRSGRRGAEPLFADVPAPSRLSQLVKLLQAIERDASLRDEDRAACHTLVGHLRAMTATHLPLWQRFVGRWRSK